MKNKIFYIMAFSLFFILSHPVIGNAKESIVDAIKYFSYELILPENQQDKKLGYYDLLMNPGEKQEVKLKLNNTSDQAIKVDIELNSAKTNGNGVIEYGPNNLKKDPSLKYDLAEIMSGPKEVRVPSKSSEIVTFVINSPIASFEGYVAGGIQLKPVVKTKQTQKTQGAIVNKFAFLIGVLLSESDVQKIKPKLKLNNVSLKLKDGSYMVFANISNTESIFVEKMAANIQITEKDNSKSSFKLKKEDMRMAPNTMMNLPIPLNNQKVNSGEYTANIQITTENGGNWTWVKNFTLSKVEAEQINKQIIEESESGFKYWFIVIVLVLLLIVPIGFIIKKYNDREK
ncbi:DUF916 and DUF3324 domain-containing protein [Candidatus Enterococcus ikei]|uniref:DUF916 and DUF3324 domain-containing protein n=1 Tax=Candidatus Enterococcus ikei TaxID=2815326 RepID=A0ABS3GUW8_9ENTE|nr:DUF916 and DUF3324 domain-containing protein [Enterococcus sp. DIV0869a]MBO0439051.1 DUF916 and DUF3324 domain-containing protein [Enterococcus sp. DIV0869a]